MVKNYQKQRLEVFCEKKLLLKIPQNSQENTCVGFYISIKLQVAGVFL